MGVVPTLQEAVRSVADSAVIIDLSEVPNIDSAAIGALLQAYVSCRKAGRQMALVGLSHRVEALLKITGVDLLFTKFGTLGEAEEALA